MVQYRKSKKVGPFRITVSQQGISTSVGYGPLRVSHGADGKVRRTVRAPGTGLYDTKVIGGAKTTPQTTKAAASSEPPVSVPKAVTQLVVMLVIFAAPMWFLFAHGLWFLAVGGLIGLGIATVAHIKGIRL
jgi:Protein of unknown function (DUF4236)